MKAHHRIRGLSRGPSPAHSSQPLTDMTAAPSIRRVFLSLIEVRPVVSVCLGILMVNGAVVLWLSFLGRAFVPAPGSLQWWNVSTLPGDNSQHLMDGYSLLHAMSGAALYFAARVLWPSWPVHIWFLLAIVSSGIWEAVENTPWVIALFNDPLRPGAYHGDSIVNALSDSAFAGLGFLAARTLPPWTIVTFAVLTEAGLVILIQDGFVLGTARLVWR